MAQSTLQDRVVQALASLIGLPLWGAARALDVEMFAFGKRYPEKNRKGEDVEVGEFSVHITCAWRVVGPTGIVVGSLDRQYPEEEDSDWSAFDPNLRTRCEARIDEWVREHTAAPLKVQGVEADRLGGFKLLLERGFALEAFPANSLRGQYSERWRLFRPRSEERHFVVTGYGVEE